MPKTDVVRLRLLPEEKHTFQEAADLAGISLSAWVRERLRKVARSELGRAGQPIHLIQSRRRA